MEWRAQYPASNLTSSQPLVRHHSYFYAAPYAGLKRIDVSNTLVWASRSGPSLFLASWINRDMASFRDMLHLC